jgi:hypothetical protein
VELVDVSVVCVVVGDVVVEVTVVLEVGDVTVVSVVRGVLETVVVCVVVDMLVEVSGVVSVVDDSIQNRVVINRNEESAYTGRPGGISWLWWPVWDLLSQSLLALIVCTRCSKYGGLQL